MLSSEEVTHDVRCDLRAYLQPAFVICVVVLAFSGVVMSRFEIEQEPWPLKQHLELLDNFDLEPYRVVSRHKIDNKDILRELGTDDYIQWVLEDMEAAQDSPVRKLVLYRGGASIAGLGRYEISRNDERWSAEYPGHAPYI